MSVYYYLHCEQCNEFTGVVGRNTSDAPGVRAYADEKAAKEVASFLVAHVDHPLRFVSEAVRYPEESPWKYNGSH